MNVETLHLEGLATMALPRLCRSAPSQLIERGESDATLAIVRFHGHCTRWDSRNLYDRFVHLYSEDELRTWTNGLQKPKPRTPRRLR
ncbi:hypothetical protein SMC26_20275 [Actinomadura fulvescens]|uniref:Uncharacterized protein n=1 Tax=Actinomadura fulvescens TaxID=46160 RepID=A0ABN3PK19_9ACTN